MAQAGERSRRGRDTPRTTAVARTLVFVATGLALAAGAGAGSAPACRDLAVIVHPDNPAQSISLTELAEVYSGERTRWPDGARIVAITAPAGSEMERAFGRRVLGRPGTVPTARHGSPVPFRPLRLAADGAAAYVALFGGAIAYVWSDAVPQGVKVLETDGLAGADDADCAPGGAAR